MEVAKKYKKSIVFLSGVFKIQRYNKCTTAEIKSKKTRGYRRCIRFVWIISLITLIRMQAGRRGGWSIS